MKNVKLYSYIGLIILSVGLLGSLLYYGIDASIQYPQDMALAKSGVQYLEDAQRQLGNMDTLTASRISQVRQDFVQANRDFSQVSANLAQIPGVAVLPHYGAVFKLVPIAMNLSQAGIVGCDVATTALKDLSTPLSTHSSGIPATDITAIQKNLTTLQGLLQTTTTQVDQLSPSDMQLDARLAPMMAKFRAALPAIQAGLQNAQTIVQVLPALLGLSSPASYLIEQLDSTEIRPGGGFIGSYGIATFQKGKLADVFMRDTVPAGRCVLLQWKIHCYPFNV